MQGYGLLPIACLLFAGCDPIYWVRVEARQGNRSAMKVVRRSELEAFDAPPIEGVRVEAWEMKDNGGKRWEAAGETDVTGGYDIPPAMGFAQWSVRCTKVGYRPVEGPIPGVPSWPFGGRRVLLVSMEPAATSEPSDDAKGPEPRDGR
jgi:hypothetical protein